MIVRLLALLLVSVVVTGVGAFFLACARMNDDGEEWLP